jgi:NitT/TauT family transport system substrate-binding protein
MWRDVDQLKALKMMRLIFKSKMMLALLATTLLGGACTESKKKPLRIGFNPWPGYEFIYLAQELRLNDKLGISVQIVEFGSLAEARRSFERGEIDVIGTTLVEFLLIRQNTQQRPKIFYVTDYSMGADVILGRASIKSIKDLKGKKVSVEPGSVSIYLLTRALEINGLQLSDVTILTSDQIGMLAAAKKGDVDAVITYTPFSIQFEKISFKAVFSSKDIPKEIVDVLVAREDVIRSRKTELRGVLTSFEDARKLSLKPDSEGIRIMANREQIPPEKFFQSLSDGITLIDLENQKADFFDSGLLIKLVNQTAKSLKSAGVIKEPLGTEHIQEWIR